LSDRLFRVSIGHRYESETFRAASIAIRNNAHRFHSAAVHKSVSNIVFSRLERKVSNKNFALTILIYLTREGTSGTFRSELTVPDALRYRLAYDASLVTDVPAIFARTVFASLIRSAREFGAERKPQCGAVSFIQRFREGFSFLSA
jgi:hypothetical protein